MLAQAIFRTLKVVYLITFLWILADVFLKTPRKPDYTEKAFCKVFSKDSVPLALLLKLALLFLLNHPTIGWNDVVVVTFTLCPVILSLIYYRTSLCPLSNVLFILLVLLYLLNLILWLLNFSCSTAVLTDALRAKVYHRYLSHVLVSLVFLSLILPFLRTMTLDLPALSSC